MEALKEAKDESSEHVREISSGTRTACAKVLGRQSSKQEKCKEVKIAAVNKNLLLLGVGGRGMVTHHVTTKSLAQ